MEKTLHSIDEYCLLYGTSITLATLPEMYEQGESGTDAFLPKDLESKVKEHFEELLQKGCKILGETPEEVLKLNLSTRKQTRIKQLWEAAEKLYDMLVSKRSAIIAEDCVR